MHSRSALTTAAARELLTLARRGGSQLYWERRWLLPLPTSGSARLPPPTAKAAGMSTPTRYRRQRAVLVWRTSLG